MLYWKLDWGLTLNGMGCWKQELPATASLKVIVAAVLAVTRHASTDKPTRKLLCILGELCVIKAERKDYGNLNGIEL